MKLTALIFLIGCLHVSAKGLSQGVTLKLSDAPLERLFSEIKKQTGYVVFYDYAAIKEAKNVSVDVKNITVEQLLNQAFKGQPFDFTIEDKTIFVTKKSPEKNLLYRLRLHRFLQLMFGDVSPTNKENRWLPASP